MKNSKYYIELTSNDNITYYQVVRRKDDAIIFSNRSLSITADKLIYPVYKDSSKVIL